MSKGAFYESISCFRLGRSPQGRRGGPSDRRSRLLSAGPLLPASLPQGLREKSASLLTDLTAGELYTLEETLEFLANQSAAVSAAPLPGDWDRAAGLYSVNEDSRAAVQALFRVAASSSQSESSSAP